jgi:drug/metabolite transporter (DMT)-like permease
VVYVLAIGAAALLGVAAAIQQRAAFRAPPGTALHLRLLWYLARQPLWLSGIATALVGNALSAFALGLGGVTLVEPLLVTSLLFALPVSAIWNRYRLGRREWAGAFAVIIGLAAFLVAGQPRAGTRTDAPIWQWALAGASIGGITIGLVALARRLRPQQEATVLGIGAGMLFGLQSALTSTVVERLIGRGLLAMLLHLTPYLVVVVALLGTLLAQSAYELAPLSVSYPSMAAVEPLAGIAIGIGVLGARLRVTPLVLSVHIVGLAVMTAGVYALAGGRLLDHHHHRSSAGPD